MDLILLPQHWSAILCIVIMIGALVFAYFKKWMMIYAVIVANFIVFVITVIYQNEIIYGFSKDVFQYAGLGFRGVYLSPELFPQIYTLFTSMFIHGGFLHIFGNMLILFFIGVPFEQRVGRKNFIIIYLLSGVIGSLTHSVLNLESAIPLVGASGAIFGIMGAFAFSYPRDEVIMPIGIGIMFLTRIKVMYAVVFFAALETIIVFIGVQDSTAHFAHLGGLLAGFLLAAILLRNKKRKKSSSDPYGIKKYDSYQPQINKKIDFSNLKPLADTPELKQILRRIENETVPQVRDVWIEHFVEKAKCPKCKNPLYHMNHKIWCEKCGFKTKY